MEICFDWLRTGSGGGVKEKGPVTVSWSRRTEHAPWNNNKLRPPPAAVTLSKQRPRPSLRMIHCINPIKPCLRNTVRWQTVRGRWNMSCTKGWMARKHTHTHTLGCSPCAQSSYSHPQAPSQCLRSPTPHLDRNIVMLNKRPAAGGQMLKPLQW